MAVTQIPLTSILCFISAGLIISSNTFMDICIVIGLRQIAVPLLNVENTLQCYSVYAHVVKCCVVFKL